jgi:hypothetical protein
MTEPTSALSEMAARDMSGGRQKREPWEQPDVMQQEGVPIKTTTGVPEKTEVGLPRKPMGEDESVIKRQNRKVLEAIKEGVVNYKESPGAFERSLWQPEQEEHPYASQVYRVVKEVQSRGAESGPQRIEMEVAERQAAKMATLADDYLKGGKEAMIAIRTVQQMLRFGKKEMQRGKTIPGKSRNGGWTGRQGNRAWKNAQPPAPPKAKSAIPPRVRLSEARQAANKWIQASRLPRPRGGSPAGGGYHRPSSLSPYDISLIY